MPVPMVSKRMSTEQGFDTFLEWCIDMVGGNQRSARGHFRHAGKNLGLPGSSTVGFERTLFIRGHVFTEQNLAYNDNIILSLPTTVSSSP
jgi:hypothetical protein